MSLCAYACIWMHALVQSGCYNKNTVQGGLNNKLSFFQARKLEIKALAQLVSDQGSRPGSQTAVFSLCPHRTEGSRELSGISFIRALIPFMSSMPLCHTHLLKAPLPNAILFGVKILTYELGVGADIQSKAVQVY